MVIWGFNFVAIKLLLKETSGISAALVRSLLMTVILVAICKLQGLSLKLERKDAIRVFIQGFLNMGIYMILFTKGMEGATAAEGAIVLGTAPLFTLFLAVVTRQEKFRWPILFGTLVAFSGVALVVAGSPHAKVGNSAFWALLTLLASAFVWATGTVVSRPILGKVDSTVMTTFAMWTGNAVLIPVGIPEAMKTDWTNLTPMAWWCLLYFSIGAGAIGFLLFYRGVRQVGAAGAMLYQYLVSPIAAVAGWLFMSQPLAPVQWLGLAVVISGVAWASSARHKAGSTANPLADQA